MPLCALLGFFERLTHPLIRPQTRIAVSSPPQSILVIKFFGLGSILLQADLVRNIRTRYPGARLIFLTFRENTKLLELLSHVDVIRAVDTRNPWRLIGSIFSNLFYFSFHRPDVAIDLEFFSKFSTLMTYLSGARWRVGFFMPQVWRIPLINVPVYFNYARHILEIYAQCGKAIGVDIRPALPQPMTVRQEARQAVQEFWRTHQISEKNVVLGVNVNASDLALCRRWPLSKFAGVVNALLDNYQDMKVLLTGTKKEKSYVAQIWPLIEENRRERVVDASGAFSLEQFIAALDKMNVFLSNDSGPFQLAQVQRVPLVSIWGAGDPALYGPYGQGQGRQRVIYRSWPCSPCLYIYRTDAGYFCNGSTQCLENIHQEEVVRAVEELANMRESDTKDFP